MPDQMSLRVEKSLLTVAELLKIYSNKNSDFTFIYLQGLKMTIGMLAQELNLIPESKYQVINEELDVLSRLAFNLKIQWIDNEIAIKECRSKIMSILESLP